MKGKKMFFQNWFKERKIQQQAAKAEVRGLVVDMKKVQMQKDDIFKAFVPKPKVRSRYNFGDKLRAKGFKYLGSGCYGSVYGHPSSNKVIKVLYRPDNDGWVPYMKWANANGYGGTYAPKLFSYKYTKNGLGLAVMEKLDQTICTKDSGDVCYVHAIAERLARDEGQSEFGRTLLDLAKPGQGQFISDFAKQFSGKGHFDLHSGNWMTRGEDLVLTDPLSSYRNDNDPDFYKGRFKAAA